MLTSFVIPWLLPRYYLTITSNTYNYNIYNALQTALGRAPNYRLEVFVTVNAGVLVGSTSTTAPAMSTGSGWHASSKIKIINNGTIIGKGGNAGNGGYNAGGTVYNGGPGSPGGDALSLSFDVTIDNNATIGGGGGGGGGGAAAVAYVDNIPSYSIGSMGSGGGGGRGYSNSSGGSGGTNGAPPGGSWYCVTVGNNGGGGNSSSPGGGGAAPAQCSYSSGSANGTARGGAGGAGGGLGAAGATGGTATATSALFGPIIGSPGAGGAAGKCIDLNGNSITWETLGNRYGSIS